MQKLLKGKILLLYCQTIGCLNRDRIKLSQFYCWVPDFLLQHSRNALIKKRIKSLSYELRACRVVAVRWRVQRWLGLCQRPPGSSPALQTWSRWCSFPEWTPDTSRTASCSGRTLAAEAPARCSPSAVCSLGIYRWLCPEVTNHNVL